MPPPTDPWYARLAFHILKTAAPCWITAWLIIALSALVAVAAFAGPWFAAIPGIVAGGAAIAKARASRATETPPDPALDPPP